ncbi:CLU1 [Candida pseudojiufengensis]|uniref:CLU1 n=1 Tax=Candida pseudojiufengensis TaxID=497109 RepID=UPI0022244A11|nr:CLU1 [Candida pseudojiufengensis]KAI5961219.1 CLU1 [Candida pseudojiufengensis]
MSEGESNVEIQEPQQVVAKELVLKIKLPSILQLDEPEISIPSHYEENLTDLRQSLNLIPKTRNLSHYSILIKGIDVEQFEELYTFSRIIEELKLGEDLKELNIDIKAKPYNLAAIYEQIVRFREVIGLYYVDRISNDLGSSGGVSKFNSIKLDQIKSKEETNGSSQVKDKTQWTSEEKAEVEKIVNSLIEDVIETFPNATKFDTINQNTSSPIKSLTISQWSPVPPYQRSKGDLLYLVLQTLENETYNITCHFSGFFVNKSSTINFNPNIKVNEKGKFYKSYLLYDLISSISPSFATTIAENEIKLSKSTEHPESYLLPHNSFLAYPWLVNESELKNIPDSSRSQLALISNGVDGSDIIRDWNNDIQTMKELPSSSFQERIIRDKLIQKSLFEFNKVATETAKNIIKGNIIPMNPGEPEDKQIYLKNGVFYSAGTATVDVFESTGGEEASRYVSSKDLSGIKIINRHELNGISTLVTCIVDYMGRRVVCQAPVPGILDPPAVEENEEEIQEKVLYGLSSDGSKILEDKSFEEPLKQIGEVFHLKPHKVKLNNQTESKDNLYVSKDTKGLKGTDGRKYVIDLYRTTPRDIEFIEQNFGDFENSYPHGEALIRHEAVNEWWKRKISVLFKQETDRLETEGKLKQQDGDEKPQIALAADQVTFNPDSFSSLDELKEDQDEVREISKFIKEKLIDEYLDEVKHQLTPFDGKQLSEQLHRQGINLRYLGYVAEQLLSKKQQHQEFIEKTIIENQKLIAKHEEEKQAESDKKKKEESEQTKEEEKVDKEDQEDKELESKEEIPSKATYDLVYANYNTLYKIIINEMIARASKHILRNLVKSLPTYLSPAAVVHFHNCLFGGEINKTPVAEIDEVYQTFYPKENFKFAELTHASVIELIEKEVLARFRYKLPQNWITEIRLPQLFREIALQFGIQWKSLNYTYTKSDFDSANNEIKKDVIETKSSKKSKKKTQQIVSKSIKRNSIFIVDDLVDFIPKIKDSSYKSTIIDEIYANARSQLSSGNKEVGMAMFAELTAIQESIYGKINPETAKFYSLIAQVYQELGYDHEAALLGRKAIILCERSCGFDSHETITAYMNSAYFEAGNDQTLNSLKLYNQAVTTWKLTYGKDHPAIINTLLNSSDSLMKVKDFDDAFNLLKQALQHSENLNGDDSEITGLIKYRIANVVISQNKIEQSKQYFEEAYDTFAKLVGPEDSMTKQISKYLSNVLLYIDYSKAKEKEKKKAISQKASAPNGQHKIKATSNSNGHHQQQNGNKSKKEKTFQSVPEIASQSVDEILKFIEGKNSTKSKKN